MDIQPTVTTRPPELSLEALKQVYVALEQEEGKLDTLFDLLEIIVATAPILIYCNTRRKAIWLKQQLKNVYLLQPGLIDAFLVFCMDETLLGWDDDREWILRQCQEQLDSNLRSIILIATDNCPIKIGIDIERVSMIINYDMAKNRQDYFSRVSRPYSRFRRSAVAASFLLVRTNDNDYDNDNDDSEMRCLRDIECFYNTEITEMTLDITDWIY